MVRRMNSLGNTVIRTIMIMHEDNTFIRTFPILNSLKNPITRSMVAMDSTMFPNTIRTILVLDRLRDPAIQTKPQRSRLGNTGYVEGPT